jgi:hypothetical protein
MDGPRKRLDDGVFVATTDSGTVTEVSMFERETSSLDSDEETLREGDMLAGRQEKKNSDFLHLLFSSS